MSEFENNSDPQQANDSSKPSLSSASTTDVKDPIEHKLEGKKPYDNILPYKMVEYRDHDSTINYQAAETGFYRIVFSNEHSWYRPKTLLWRYCLLSPTDHIKNDSKIHVRNTQQPQKTTNAALIDMEDDQPIIDTPEVTAA